MGEACRHPGPPACLPRPGRGATTSSGSRAPEHHDVVLYDRDDELVVAVAAFVTEGLRAGDGVLVVATPAHRSALESLLLAHGTDVARAAAAGQYRSLDAAATLASFSPGGVLDAGLFERVVAGALDAAAAGGRAVRAFGEMVALLWDDGDAAGAIALEELWNDLAGTREFALLCAYPMRALEGHLDLLAVEQLCRAHSDVVPPDSYAGPARAEAPAASGGHVSRVFVASPSAVKAARSWAGTVLERWGLAELVDDGRLLASELATNAVDHAGTAFRVSVRRSADGIRISVEDLGPADAELVEPMWDSTSGRGVGLVAELSTRWGREWTPTGKLVWAELAAAEREGEGVGGTSAPSPPAGRAPGATGPRRLVGAGLDRVRAFLPRGDALPESAWAGRHAGVCWLVWAHVAVLPLIALVSGHDPGHGLAMAAALAVLALSAAVGRLSKAARSVLATLGLMLSSATVVHLFDGLIEAHFHFFVMVVVASLYQSWRPFVVAIGFVVLHHGLLPALDPSYVFDHPAARDDPWLWAAVHGMFILAQSIACLVCWRLSEAALDRERTAREALARAHEDLSAAQALAGVGSWEWEIGRGAFSWSEQFYALAGLEPGGQPPSLQAFLHLVHPADRARIAGLISAAVQDSSRWDDEFRLVRPDGSERLIHGLGVVARGARGPAMLGTCQDVTDRKQSEVRLAEANARLVEIAHRDGLTGLLNRRRLDEQLLAAASSPRANPWLSVLLIDIDHFKRINDTFGHTAGDAILRAVADRISAAVRDGDTAGRWGGEEFLVILPGSTVEAAAEVAERVRLAICGAPFEVGTGGDLLDVTVSIGCYGDTSSKPEVLVNMADRALYSAKGAGRNQVVARRRPDAAATMPARC